MTFIKIYRKNEAEFKTRQIQSVSAIFSTVFNDEPIRDGERNSEANNLCNLKTPATSQWLILLGKK